MRYIRSQYSKYQTHSRMTDNRSHVTKHSHDTLLQEVLRHHGNHLGTVLYYCNIASL